VGRPRYALSAASPSLFSDGILDETLIALATSVTVRAGEMALADLHDSVRGGGPGLGISGTHPSVSMSKRPFRPVWSTKGRSVAPGPWVLSGY